MELENLQDGSKKMKKCKNITFCHFFAFGGPCDVQKWVKVYKIYVSWKPWLYSLRRHQKKWFLSNWGRTRCNRSAQGLKMANCTSFKILTHIKQKYIPGTSWLSINFSMLCWFHPERRMQSWSCSVMTLGCSAVLGIASDAIFTQKNCKPREGKIDFQSLKRFRRRTKWSSTQFWRQLSKDLGDIKHFFNNCVCQAKIWSKLDISEKICNSRVSLVAV